MITQEFSGADFLRDPEQMLSLYARGAFPMADEDGLVDWYFPKIRTIISPDKYNIPRSFRKSISQLNFEVRIDTQFLSVVRACADRSETWISEEIIEAYLRLEKLGHVHTVETWNNNRLVGGLYGITYHGAFFGESMFSRVSQASKFALMKLLEHLNEKKFVLLDVQFMTEHLRMFGAKEISFEEYSGLLQKAYNQDCHY